MKKGCSLPLNYYVVTCRVYLSTDDGGDDDDWLGAIEDNNHDGAIKCLQQ